MTLPEEERSDTQLEISSDLTFYGKSPLLNRRHYRLRHIYDVYLVPKQPGKISFLYLPVLLLIKNSVIMFLSKTVSLHFFLSSLNVL